MKKSKLIEILNNIDGNPEIKLWNGFVGDWVDIEKTLVPVDLFKMTETYYIESCRLEKCRDLNDWSYQFSAEDIASLKVSYKTNCSLEINNYVTQEDISKKRYVKTTVLMIESKTKGVKTWDRIGDIIY